MICSKSNVMQCSFANWYKSFEDVTVKSIIIPMPESFLTYLHTDGLVLPESSTHGLYTKSSATAMDGDEDDPDIRDEDLMNMYEDDWSTPGQSEASQEMPEFGKFDAEVKEAIKLLGGRVFPKLNWSSPKDATWISFDKSLLCTCPSDVYLLLKSSEFIAHDLDQPFIHCSESDSSPIISYVLVLRQWQPPDPSTEFRCFVRNKKLVGICQRQTTKLYPNILQEKAAIVHDICQFHKNKISQTFSGISYVFDVIRKSQGNVKLVDFNPCGVVTDSLLFTWDEIEAMVGDEEGTFVEKAKQEMTSNSIFHIKGMNPETMFEEIKEYFSKYGEVGYVEMKKGDTEGYCRMKEANSAGPTLEKAKAANGGKVVIHDTELQVRAVEGEEELGYWINMYKDRAYQKDLQRDRRNLRHYKGKKGRAGRWTGRGSGGPPGTTNKPLPAEFRCVESEAGVKCGDYASYALPRDVQDLTSGEDPAKLMDLMKLKITKQGPWVIGDSSDEEDEEGT